MRGSAAISATSQAASDLDLSERWFREPSNDPNGGTATTLDLIDALLAQQRKGDATKNHGFYDLGNSAARPEAAPWKRFAPFCTEARLVCINLLDIVGLCAT